MERKKGEIFEYNGEWYQCTVGRCTDCHFSEKRYICKQFITKNFCTSGITFKKLKKVGEPYTTSMGKTIQNYLLETAGSVLPKDVFTLILNEQRVIAIELKQNKEDMEENKTTFSKENNTLTRIVDAYINEIISDKELIKSIKEMSDEYPYNKNNLKPFSWELAKQGKPVCTRDGRKARVICFDRISGDDYYKIVACVTAFDGDFEEVIVYGTDGYIVDSQKPKDEDLMMLPEKKEGWINISSCPDNGYSNYDSGVIVFKTKEEAINFTNNKDYIDTVKVTWEE